MKKIVILLLMFSTISVFSQKDSLQLKVDAFTARIQKAEGLEKMLLLDTLCGLTIDVPRYKYDSISKVTIAHAIKLDSINFATKHLATLLYLFNKQYERPEEGLQIFQEFHQKKLRITDTLALAYLYLEASESYFNSGFEKKSIVWYDKAMKMALKASDSSLHGRIMGHKAYALSEMGDFATASTTFQKALVFFMKKKDTTNIIRIRGGLSIIYGKNEFFNECLQELDEIEKLAKAANNIPAQIVTLGNMANAYHGQQNYAKSIESNHKALQFIEQYPMFQSLEDSRLLGQITNYLEVDSLQKAKQMLLRLEKILQASNNDYSIQTKYMASLARIHFKEKKYTKAKEVAIQLLSLLKNSSSYEDDMEANNILHSIEEKLGNKEAAYNYYKTYTKIKDSIESVKKTNALAYYQTLYETEKRDATIQHQEAEITLLDTKNKIKSQWLLLGGLGLLSLFIIAYLIRAQMFVKKQQKLQKQFSHDLIKGQEEERSRLARELHDSVGQKLMLLSKTTKNLGNENAEQLASSTLEEVRTISRGLHPSNLERLGLTEAVNALVYDINANTDLFFTEEIDNIDNTLSKEAELHLYRIIQESLSNIVKHSGAKAVKMEIQKKENSIDVLVSDNGKGFDFESKYKNMSLGLKTLFERAKIIGSKLILKSEINQGTVISLNVPI
ncbi:sensor histidine kinase [uncultured Kordia sp.]|uniref:tetratricopeptide repeat-containing sensor histidine kinase n=1 Tax=uncultured Kordia sp. TaxID=507699 RepID=UPI00260D78C1|nr:sensor histidine kinase [uncultured Kordia sp.]